MFPKNSLLFVLRRCSSSVANYRSELNWINDSKLLLSAQAACERSNAGCLAKHGVRLLTSSASADDPNQNCDPEVIQCLLNNGFPEVACSQIVAKLQPLRLDQNKLDRTLGYWGACQFGHDRLIYLLTENPELLMVEQQQIMNCFVFLSKMFSQNYVYKILLNCPQALFEKHSQISSKLDFLNKTLGVPNSEIVNSSTLGHPLGRMRVRYEFLKRCGIYKTVVAGAATSNPSLSQMFDTSDEHFAKQVARLSPFEFEVFQNLYAMETDDVDSESSDSDSE